MTRGSGGAMGIEESLDDFYSALLDDDPVELYERAPCGYLSTTPDGTIVKTNATFLTWTGYDRAELLGRRTFSELLSAGGRIYHETHYAPMLRMQGSAREIAFDVVCADGRRLPVLVNSVLERDVEGEPAVVRIAVFDATDRREYERELVRAKERAEASERRVTALVRTLQQTLIPPAPAAIPGLVVTASYRPAGDGDEVGGDFYDVFEIGTGDWVIAVGDVCGKGVEAAVVTALARYTIRAAAVRHREPSEVLEVLNDVLRGDRTDRFCTAAVARLRQRADGWSVTVGCGGHPPPVLSTGEGDPSFVGRPGTLLGVLADVAFTDTVVELARGDALVLYTDGITEARAGGEFYGEERLLATVAANRSADDLGDAVARAAVAFQDGRTRDDIVVVAVTVA